jgi:hypothetical protein
MARTVKHPEDDDGIGAEDVEDAIRKTRRQDAAHFRLAAEPAIRERVLHRPLEGVPAHLTRDSRMRPITTGLHQARDQTHTG